MPDQASSHIVFLTDYGLDDEFVGICHAVMAGIAPGTPVIDLTHGIPPGDILRGALVLARAAPYLPERSIVVAVVDPGVGTSRRPVGIETGSGLRLVGPDNGLLSLAADAASGVADAVEISSRDVLLTPVSATFHGRDVFAPAAAHLAVGASLRKLGPPVDRGSLVRVSVPPATSTAGRISAAVLIVDRFGNVKLGATAKDLEVAGLRARPSIDVHTSGRTTVSRRVATFGDVEPGGLALIDDSSGWLALVVNRGSAAMELGIGPGDTVGLGDAPQGAP